MPPIPFEAPPGTAQWNHPITYTDYTKLLNGHTPHTMDDKLFIKTEIPSSQTPNTALFHIYYGWQPREMIRLEIVAGDPKDTGAREWATLGRIWWKREVRGEGEQDVTEEEEEAKRSVVSTCNYVLGCEMEFGDGEEGESGGGGEEDQEEEDGGLG